MSPGTSPQRSFVIIGGGPAGLTAAYELTRYGQKPVVLERGSDVGGLARTVNYKGFHFDMGGHRFFTKSPEVNRMWTEVLLGDFLRRPRLSRIYYRKKLFRYPLRPWDALLKIGPLEALRIVLSYLRWQLFPYREEETFEQWVTNRFGQRMFVIFFKTYTEKVWGLSCSELKAEWAAQRIKDLSLKTVLLNFVTKPRTTVTTLIEEFHYPRLGPGMMWRAVRDRVEEQGGTVRLDAEVVKLERRHDVVETVVVSTNGHRETITGTDFISSMPVSELVAKLDPPAPRDVLEAARRLKYRDFLTVCLIIDRPQLFPDNWIYVHDAEVKVGRIQNFKNWSPEMVPDPSKSSLGLEYFCSEGDELWSLPDEELLELGKRELAHIGLVDYEDVEDGCVFRVPKSYPVYDAGYREYLWRVKEFVGSLRNCQTIGRNGLHRYNNQDHSMLTGMYAVRNALLRESNDLWSVNTEQEYQEEIREPEAEKILRETLDLVLARIDPIAAGAAVGSVGGGLLALLTFVLVLKGGPVVGPNLSLLRQYFPGYAVSAGGSLLGLAYGTGFGFLTGWAFAHAANLTHFMHVALIRGQARGHTLRKLMDFVF